MTDKRTRTAVNVVSKWLPQIKDLNGNTIENIETVFESDRYACNDTTSHATAQSASF